MVSEYQLFNYLLFLKSNYFFKREIKKKISNLKTKDYRDIYNLLFNNNKILIFIKIISVYFYFNKISYKKHLELVSNFILTIAALIPIFKHKEKQLYDYQKIKNKLLLLGCKEPIKQWYNNSSNFVLPNFLIKNNNLKKDIIQEIQKLANITGNIFFIFNKNKKNNYKFGSLLMLFYLLDLETKKTLLIKDTTNWNLKIVFSYENLFINKLLILNKLINSAMILEKEKFNFYIRIMNY